MFKEKVNTRTDGRTDGRTTDNGPWHKLAGLRPVELKMAENSSNLWKTLWEKEKLLIKSNFSISLSVFKRLCTADT